MISCLGQRRDNAAQGFEDGSDIGIRGPFAAVMQADDASIARAGENALGDLIGRELPVEADDGPHDAGEPQFGLHLAESEPAHAIGGAHQGGSATGDGGDGVLSAGEIVFDHARRFQGKVQMGV